MPKRKKSEAERGVLKGWQQIAAFLGQPVSVVQRRLMGCPCESKVVTSEHRQ